MGRKNGKADEKSIKKMPWEIKKIHILLTFWKWWKGRQYDFRKIKEKGKDYQ